MRNHRMRWYRLDKKMARVTSCPVKCLKLVAELLAAMLGAFKRTSVLHMCASEVIIQMAAGLGSFIAPLTIRSNKVCD